MIVYKSKLAKLLTFIANFKTIMFFGITLTEKESLTRKEIMHENTHCKQYKDCFALGLGIAIILMFILFAFNITFVYPLFILPLLLFYIWYGIEYVIKRIKYKDRKQAYLNVGFEKQAYRIAATWDKPCEEQEHYYSFGWLQK